MLKFVDSHCSESSGRCPTPLERFHSFMLSTSRSALSSTDFFKPDKAVCAPFPMPLPFPVGSGKQKNSQTFSRLNDGLSRRDTLAQCWVNWQVVLLNFLSCGCPKSHTGYPRVPPFLSQVHHDISQRLLADARHFVHSSGGDMPTSGRGRAHICNMINSHAPGYSSHSHLAGISCRPPTPHTTSAHTVAGNIDLSRISLPKSAGLIQPLDFLCPERARVFKGLNKIVLPHNLWPTPGVKPCMMIDP